MAGPSPIIILGPTAGGKSELAVELAEQRGGEVLGADSMQVYRHVQAGTAKPGPDLRRRVRHHLIDLVEPTQRFTAAHWLGRAEAGIADLQKRNIRPIVVGGTNLYLKVLLEGMFDAPPRDAAFRRGLAGVSAGDLHQRVQAMDPAAAERIHPHDRKRLTRALEVHHLTGRPISDQQQEWDQPPPPPARPAGETEPSPAYRHDPILIGLAWNRENLNRRINARVKHMFEPTRAETESLPDEVSRLEQAGLLGSQVRQALGYKQVLAALQGHMTADQAKEQTKIQTRRFARKQRTWLKRYRGVHWLQAGDRSVIELAREAWRTMEAAEERSVPFRGL